MHRAAKGSELPPPTLPHVPRHGIGVHTARHLHASIRTALPMAAGDLLELFWGDRFATAHVLQAGELGAQVTLAVPAQVLYPGLNTLHYRLLQPGQHPRSSPPCQVAVKLDCPGGQVCTPENPGLAPLRLPAALQRHGLDLRRLDSGVAFHIAPYLHMAEGDAITVRWADLRLDLTPLRAKAVGTGVVGVIPRELILEAGADEHLEASYCILDRVGNCSRWAPAACLRVGGEAPRRYFYAYS
ncbi:hypothetical protein [Pseudomonas aegrilactucae]|uniref:Uncharacterized protein n=1 Tax=Pseudomonas aegrilactucae TaxID=2854028 RepID=A0A9Q3AGR9_9PSED|nr:hypothetical protein [Pseudomonas aegrilactucae]MBV6289475.1 hypothetical protein [Pseudomonas aegrilactucae]